VVQRRRARTACARRCDEPTPTPPQSRAQMTISEIVTQARALPRCGAAIGRGRSAGKPGSRRVPERAGGSRRGGGLERGDGIQTTVVARIARSRPPSPKVMPHGRRRDLLANLLALRCAPRSCSRAVAAAAASFGVATASGLSLNSAHRTSAPSRALPPRASSR